MANMDGWFRSRRHNYAICFGSPEGRAVLADLAKFCNANQPTFDPNPHVAAYNEGLRRVYLRIKSISGMSDAAIETLIADQAAALRKIGETDHGESAEEKVI